jgi:NADH dehydrogenase
VNEESARYLVTGANGHLGRRLLARLSASRATPTPSIALVRSESASASIRSLPFASSFEVRIADWNDHEALARAMQRCTRVVHLVGILKETRATRYEDAHERTAETLATVAARAGVERIVYLSILGSRSTDANACLASKGRAEEILLRSKVPTTVLQVPMVLGLGEIAAKALRGKALAPFVVLPRGGATLEQPVDAEDVVSTILALFERPELAGQVLELAGPESLTHRQLVARAAALHGRSPRILAVPVAAVRFLASLFERFSASPPLTRAMLGVLEHDDRIDPRPLCGRLGITLTPLDETLRRSVGPGVEAQ